MRHGLVREGQGDLVVGPERDEHPQARHDLYRAYSDKIVGADGKVLARVRVTDKVWWGEVIPVNEK